MDNFVTKTSGNASPVGKPKVFFTCHPDDIGYYNEISETILMLHDCAIYHTPDMSEAIYDAYSAADLGSMNLFVIPVTVKLLTASSRTIDDDLAFAIKSHIPVLPLIMIPNFRKNGYDALYEKRFGRIQYLSTLCNDLSAIGYKDKLKKYLSSQLFDAETVEHIRGAFDARIFLSYRKKDRAYANDLMRLIHKDPRYRSVAIWYDEYLILGEDYRDNIYNELQSSDLFLLLVTPNLVNELNFVFQHEYPRARDMCKPILPVEMLKTNREYLEKLYPMIPACVDGYSDEMLSKAVGDALNGIPLGANDDDPMHNYLIGLAYLLGIDVEVNKEYAVALLTEAAEKGAPQAMLKLYDYYSAASDADAGKKALYWAQRIYDAIDDEIGISELQSMNNFLVMSLQYDDGDDDIPDEYKERLDKAWRIPLTALGNLAVAYGRVGDKQKELELCKKHYALCSERFGERDVKTLISLQNLAYAHYNSGNISAAVDMYKTAYELSISDIDKNHDEACDALSVLATLYFCCNQEDKAVDALLKSFEIRCKYYGEYSFKAYRALRNVADAYDHLGNTIKAFEVSKRLFAIYNSIANVFDIDYEKMEILEFAKKALLSERKKYRSSFLSDGAKHSKRISALGNLADIYEYLEDYPTALSYYKKLLVLQQKACCDDEAGIEKTKQSIVRMHKLVFNETSDNNSRQYAMIISSYKQGNALYQAGEWQNALDVFKRVYRMCLSTYGKVNKLAAYTLYNMALLYDKLGNLKKSLELFKSAYDIRREVLGETEFETLVALERMADIYAKLGDKKHEATAKAELKLLNAKRTK